MEHLSIIVPYCDQRKVYMGIIYKEARVRKMNLSEFPRVITIGSSQGNEASIIIFDSVISQADTGRDMGFLTDSRRLNVACTRATDVLLIVENAAVLNKRLNSDHKIKQLGGYKKKLRQNKPYLIAYFEELNQRNAWITKDLEPITETPEILQLRKFEAEPDDDEVDDDEVNKGEVNDDKVNDDEVENDKLNDDKVEDDNVEDDKINNNKVSDDKIEIKTDTMHDEAQFDIGNEDSQETVTEQNWASALWSR